MPIKPFVAASMVFSCLFALSSTIAAAAANPSDAEPAVEETTVNAAPLKRIQAPTSEAEADTESAMPAAAPRLRTGDRSGSATHRDARACLEKVGNTAIIQCAEKYRYR